MKLALALVATVAFQSQQQEQAAIQVAVQPATAEVEVDRTLDLDAAVTRDGAAVADATVRWISTDSEVASVDADGVITAHRPGSARVYAVFGQSAAGFAEVRVPQLPPHELEARLPVRTVATGTSVPLEVTARTRLGEVLERPALVFASDDPGVATVDATGRVTGVAPGSATIRVAAGAASGDVQLRVESSPAQDYRMTPTSVDARTGDVVRLRVDGVDAQGHAVLATRPAWSVSRAGASVSGEGEEGVFVAEAPGSYEVVASVGPSIERRATVRVTPREHDERLELVGRGAISTHHSGDTWVFEGVDGRDYAIIGTFMHDWAKVWDVTDPGAPVLTDSVQLDARRINDVKIHPNGRIGIVTREGASNRRNGIVLLDLSDPAHPSVLSEYQETVTGGVHNVWIRGEHELVYAVHNGTSDVHIIDISNPREPREVGRWGLDKQVKTLHDVIVQDGYAYLSYWDDGLVILDAGAGSHGGTPTEPTFVSQYAYPIGNTHVAWRHGDYVFVGDEIFPDEWDPTKPIEARGYIHVVDVSDIERPVEVAKYEVPQAGAHNVWAEGDRLYVGYYQGGLRVVDISGELRGDLYRQGREIDALRTAAPDAMVPDWSMTWGAQIHEGNIFTSDMNSGLWIARLIPSQPTT